MRSVASRFPSTTGHAVPARRGDRRAGRAAAASAGQQALSKRSLPPQLAAPIVDPRGRPGERSGLVADRHARPIPQRQEDAGRKQQDHAPSNRIVTGLICALPPAAVLLLAEHQVSRAGVRAICVGARRPDDEVGERIGISNAPQSPTTRPQPAKTGQDGRPRRDVCGSEIVAAAPIRTVSPLPLGLVGP